MVEDGQSSNPNETMDFLSFGKVDLCTPRDTIRAALLTKPLMIEHPHNETRARVLKLSIAPAWGGDAF